jgi:hypothetical protein
MLSGYLLQPLEPDAIISYNQLQSWEAQMKVVRLPPTGAPLCLSAQLLLLEDRETFHLTHISVADYSARQFQQVNKSGLSVVLHTRA